MKRKLKGSTILTQCCMCGKEFRGKSKFNKKCSQCKKLQVSDVKYYRATNSGGSGW